MNLFYPIKIAIRNLLAAKVRSFLTILGIIIGVGSVILIMSIGSGAQALILDQVQAIGSNLIGVLPGKSDEDGPPAAALGIQATSFKYDDFKSILNKNNVPEIEAGAAYVTGSDKVVYKGQSYNYDFTGTTHQYPEVQSAEIDKGRFFNEAEDTNLSRVAVLGFQVKEDFFGQENPVNKKIKIGNEYFTVIGYFKEKGAASLGVAGQDDSIFIPLFTAQKILLGIDHLTFARFKVSSENEIARAKENMRLTLRSEHDLESTEEDDFSVRDLASAVETISTITSVLTIFLALIAAISLLVGGVGIMNIMLISVNERIREVGLRKAVGAKRHHIITQFLIESITITVAGGLIGITGGVLTSLLVSLIINALGYDWKFIISSASLISGIVVSISVGVLFGLYPAFKASKISPIEALRHE